METESDERQPIGYSPQSVFLDLISSLVFKYKEFGKKMGHFSCAFNSEADKDTKEGNSTQHWGLLDFFSKDACT